MYLCVYMIETEGKQGKEWIGITGSADTMYFTKNFDTLAYGRTT